MGADSVEDEACATSKTTCTSFEQAEAKKHELYAVALAARNVRASLQQLISICSVQPGNSNPVQSLSNSKVVKLRGAVNRQLAELTEKASAAKADVPGLLALADSAGQTLPNETHAGCIGAEHKRRRISPESKQWSPQLRLCNPTGSSSTNRVRTVACWHPLASGFRQKDPSVVAVLLESGHLEVWEKNDLSWHCKAVEDLLGLSGNAETLLVFSVTGHILWLAVVDKCGRSCLRQICLSESTPDGVITSALHYFDAGDIPVGMAPIERSVEEPGIALMVAHSGAGVHCNLSLALSPVHDSKGCADAPAVHELRVQREMSLLWAGVPQEFAEDAGLASVHEGQRIMVWLPSRNLKNQCSSLGELRLLDCHAVLLARMPLGPDVAAITVPPQDRCPVELLERLGQGHVVPPALLLMECIGESNGHSWQVGFVSCKGYQEASHVSSLDWTSATSVESPSGSVVGPTLHIASQQLLAARTDSIDYLLDWTAKQWHPLPPGWKVVGMGEEVVVLGRMDSVLDEQGSSAVGSGCDLVFMEPA